MLKVEYPRKMLEKSKDYGDKRSFGAIQIKKDQDIRFFVGEIINQNYEAYYDDISSKNKDCQGNYGTEYRYIGIKEGNKCLTVEYEYLKKFRTIFYPFNQDKEQDRMASYGFIYEPWKYPEYEIIIDGEKYNVYYGNIKYRGYYTDRNIFIESGEPYVHDYYHGYGELYDNEKNVLIYEGQWNKGKRQGFGKSYFKDITGKNKVEYEGYWYENMKHGYGKLYDKVTGKKYNGHFKRDVYQESKKI